MLIKHSNIKICGFQTWYETRKNGSDIELRVHLPNHEPGQMTEWEKFEPKNPKLGVFQQAVQRVREWMDNNPDEAEKIKEADKARAQNECYHNWLNKGRYTRFN